MALSLEAQQQPRWVSCPKGCVPPDNAAVFAETRRGCELVGRARRGAEWVMCTLVTYANNPSNRKFIPLLGNDDRSEKLTNYEVLCDANEKWERINSSDPLPLNALPIGVCEEYGALYAGRFYAFGTIIVGKVSSKTQKCYGYMNGEHERSEFEIMVLPTELDNYSNLVPEEVETVAKLDMAMFLSVHDPSAAETQQARNTRTPQRRRNRKPRSNARAESHVASNSQEQEPSSEPNILQLLAKAIAQLNVSQSSEQNVSQEPSQTFDQQYVRQQNNSRNNKDMKTNKQASERVKYPKRNQNRNNARTQQSTTPQRQTQDNETTPNSQIPPLLSVQVQAPLNSMTQQQQNYISQTRTNNTTKLDAPNLQASKSPEPVSTFQVPLSTTTQTIPRPQQTVPRPQQTVPRPQQTVPRPQPQQTVPRQQPQQTVPRPQPQQTVPIIPQPQQTVSRPQQTVSRPQQTVPQPQQTVPRPQPQQTVPRPQQTVPRPQPQQTVPRPQQTVPIPQQTTPRPQQTMAREQPVTIDHLQQPSQFDTGTNNFVIGDSEDYEDVEIIKSGLHGYGTASPHWIQIRGNVIPSGAFVGGNFKGSNIYVARAKYKGQIIPASVIDGVSGCTFSYGDDVLHTKNIYKVLCAGDCQWIRFSQYQARIPDNAIFGGYDGSRMPLYIGRVQQGSSQMIGKVLAKRDGSYECCITDNYLFTYDEFEILVTKQLATPRQSAYFTRSEDRASENTTEKQLITLELSEKTQFIIDKMINSIRSHAGSYGGNFSSYHIIKIQHIINKPLFREYVNRRNVVARENGGNANEMQLFHGSSVAKEIAENGFDERYSKISGMFGAGIYFADHSSKSNQYAFGLNGGCPRHNDNRCMHCARLMLLCRVTMGKVAEFTDAQNRLAHAPPGYNSVKGVPSAGGLAYPEYIVYRGEQAFPDFLITYKLLP